MNKIKRRRLDELKIQASILLKDFQSTDDQKCVPAAKRLLQLPFLQYSKTEQILNDRSFFRLKHALWTVAIEHGFDSWQALRHQYIFEDCMYDGRCAAFLNVWFAKYEDADAYHKKHSGYLLQFRKDYIVCQQEYINTLGLGDYMQEWKAIDYNFVKPADAKAWKRLFEVAKKNYLNREEPQPTKPLKTNRPEWLKNHIKEKHS